MFLFMISHNLLKRYWLENAERNVPSSDVSKNTECFDALPRGIGSPLPSFLPHSFHHMCGGRNVLKL
jgi:hypothetical protein